MEIYPIHNQVMLRNQFKIDFIVWKYGFFEELECDWERLKQTLQYGNKIIIDDIEMMVNSLKQTLQYGNMEDKPSKNYHNSCLKQTLQYGN